jgi:hypothetical protein
MKFYLQLIGLLGILVAVQVLAGVPDSRGHDRYQRTRTAGPLGI